MTIRNTSATYGSVAKFFHWLIFLLVFFMLIYGYFMDDFPKDSQPLVFNIHKLIGLSILLLMVLRATWALSNPKPMLPIGTPCWERFAERSMHLLLYLALIMMPLVGWIGSSSAGKAPHLGSWIFALPLERNKALIDTMFTIHKTLAIAIIVLISLHVLAGLYHHIIKKDDVLRRMMPHGHR